MAGASIKDLRLDQQLCFAVYSAAHAFNRFYKPLLGKLGLTYPQYLVLLVLWEADGPTVSAIGDKLLLDSGTLTPVLKRLEAMGLVERKRGARDERQVLIRLTNKGRDLRKVAESFPAKILDASECADEDFDQLRSRLVNLREKLDKAAA